MTQVSIIGLDLAKNVLSGSWLGGYGRGALQPKTASGRGSALFREDTALPGRHGGLRRIALFSAEITALGHDVRLIPPVYVKPFVKRGKTDAADAEAICEAASRKTMRFVPVKTAEQQASAMVLKTRALLVRQQTQAMLRAHLSELGVIAGVGMAKLAALIEIVRDKSDARLPEAARFALGELATLIETLTRQIEKLEREIVMEAKKDESPAPYDHPWRWSDYGGFGEGLSSGSRRLRLGPSLRLGWG